MPDEARKALTQIVALLGKPGDAGFQPEDSLLLAEAHFELGRLDARQAGTKRPEDAGARRAFTELLDAAVEKHADGVKLLIGYDKDHPKSVAARSQLALGYMELGQFVARKGDNQDARVAFNESVKLYIELTSEQPDNSGYSSGLALTYNEAAALIQSTKPGKGALEALEYQNHSVELARRVHAQDPKNSDAGLRLAAFLLHNGELQESGRRCCRRPGTFHGDAYAHH